MTDVHDGDQLAVLERRIDEWLAAAAAANPAIAAVDRGDPGDPVPTGVARWYVRMRGEAKEFTTVWLTLGQRTLQYETYVMPAPAEHVGEVYELALRHNVHLVGAHFAIGVEDALFLRGELPLVALSEPELDRILGSLYAYVERTFRPLLELGYASKFASPGE
jgi:hypothetical protein